MYLLCDRSINVNREEPLHIEFSLTLQDGEESYRLAAKVARVAGNGVGVAFGERYPSAIAALSQLAANQSASTRQKAMHNPSEIEEGAGGLIVRCRDISADYLRQFVQRLFLEVNDALQRIAEEGQNGKSSITSFSVAYELRKKQPDITNRFTELVDGQYELLTTPGYRSRFVQKGATQGELTLIDTRELDNWLAVRAKAARLEESLGDNLEALEIRFERLSVNPVTLENNPVGPFTIVSAFREVLEEQEFDEEVNSIIFSTVGELLNDSLKSLYDELNGILIAAGIEPEISNKLEVVNKSEKHSEGGSFSGSVNNSENAEQTTPVYQNVTSSTAAMLNTNVAVDVKENAVATTRAEEPVPVPMSYARLPTTTRQQVEDDGATTYQRVQELMRLQKEVIPDVEDRAARPTDLYSSKDLVQALGSVQTLSHERQMVESHGHASYLQQKVGELTGDEGRALSEADNETLTYVGGLFNSLLQDELIPPHAKPWFVKLEVPLLQAGLLDASLLQDESHPARHLLNHLEKLGDRLQGNDTERAMAARARIEDILDAIPSKIEHDPNVFVDAISVVEGIENEIEKEYKSNLARLLQPRKKESKLNQARRSILDALNHRLGQRDVPKVILELLDSGWKNLLLRTYLKQGGQSEPYRLYLDVIDQLYARLMEVAPYSSSAVMQDEGLLESIESTLSSISEDTAKIRQLFDTIKAHLNGESNEALETRYVPELTSKMVRKGRTPQASKPEGMAEDIWQLLLIDLEELQEGEFFGFTDEEKGVLQAKLVWHDTDEARYVFADNSGNKLLDLDLGEIARLLHNRVLSRLDQKSMSATERATYQFLESLHNKLAHQALHDELTGLLNRKAFQRQLEEAVIDARSGSTTYVLCYLDIDRFNIINTTCGHTEGDALLVKIARLLEDKVGDEAVIGRLGGDEFCLLFTDCGRARGLKLATEVQEAIRNMRFGCESNEFKVTASIGMAEIDQYSESSGQLLSTVDAATFTAKDMGRDNIQIHNIENERISNRRTILDWVGRINVLLDKNLIQLRCQKIQPIHSAQSALPHYEVLLDVMDEEGNKVPLDEFIAAAECYNRINDIDTWVVDSVLDWMELHQERLEGISAMAVNLSGSSVVNRRFMEHLGKRLSAPGFPACKVCFEVTETIAINNLDSASRFMKRLKQTGCQFSLDDFGTGASSYSYLRTLPIDYLKIDGSFVKDIARNTNDYAVVKSINEIGHTMGKKTIAEYVENEFAYQALSQIGIDYAQGFGIEKPIPLQQLFE